MARRQRNGNKPGRSRLGPTCDREMDSPVPHVGSNFLLIGECQVVSALTRVGRCMAAGDEDLLPAPQIARKTSDRPEERLNKKNASTKKCFDRKNTFMPGSPLARAAYLSLFPLVLTLVIVGALRGAGESPNPSRQPRWMLPGSSTPTHGEWGDQGNGNYANPVMPGDYSDLDAIQVGKDYYAISSTFQMSPGVVVLHSQDLVHWQIIGHAVDDLTLISPKLNWDRMDSYGRGIWAGSIRFHSGRYWIYFNTPDEGFFMTSAKNPAGPWEPLHCLWKTSGWDDPCPFWDDDGQGYLVTSHYAPEPPDGKSYNIHLFKLSSDGKTLDMSSDKIIHQSPGSEANKLYKIHGYYYHYYSEVKDEGRVAMMERSRHLYGPYETHQLNHVGNGDREPNQGGLVQAPDGGWWFVTHQGSAYWAGRTGCLLPVTWINDWPIIGAVGDDGIGNMVWRARKPILGKHPAALAFDDEFTAPHLQPGWEWNYQPRADRWSLTERPGFLRMRAFAPLRPDDLKAVGNILTQRSTCAKANQVTVKIDITGMQAGQTAGLCHFGATQSWIGVKKIGGVATLSAVTSKNQDQGPPILGAVLWLRSEWDQNGNSQYSYSLDGNAFIPFSSPYPLTWGDYRGDRIGVFTYGDRGYIDLDWFHYRVE
jgi:beta-xylosidase